MIILYTQNLAKQIGLGSRKIGLPEFANPDALWHGNVFLHKRKKVLHLCHEASRYTIFIYDVKKKDFENLPFIINEHLNYHIIKDKILLKETQYLLAMSKNFSYFKKTNRKVLGTMNSMKFIFETLCQTENKIDDKNFSYKINHMLYQLDGEYIYPSEVFKSYLKEATLVRKVYEEFGNGGVNNE